MPAELSFHHITVSRQKINMWSWAYFLWWISQLMWKETEPCILCLLTDIYVFARVANRNHILQHFAMIGKMAPKSWHIKKEQKLAWTKFSGTSNNCEGIANALGITTRTVSMLPREKPFMLLHYLSALTVHFLHYSITELPKWSCQ